jgi:lipoprotein-releasing system ATP-binding protein
LEVLRGVSFEVGAGEMLAVMGASGAGKSTLLHLLGGLEAADAGSIKLGEVEMTSASRASLSRLRNERIGFVFQFHHLLPDLTAMENVALPMLINRAKRQESNARAAAMLRSVGLGERLDYNTGLLSGGEQQRVALARALIREPRLVLADEPTGNLDAATGELITARLASFCKEQGAAVIIATHNERVAKICDRTLVLRDGKLV